MKFGDILIENFLSIQSARVVLGARGLVNIEGSNLDDTSANSNGAGKSSIFDALMWCLFDETARGVSGDSVINRLAGKGTKVDVELLEGDEQWKVIRHRKHKPYKNELHLWHYAADGTATNLTQGKNDLTQAKVLEILGCSKEVFKGAVYSGQEQMPDLPGMTDKNLKVLVEEASGTTLLDKGHRLALDGVTAARAKMQTAINALESANAASAHHHNALVGSTARRTAWEEQRALRVTQLATAAREAAGHAKNIAEVAKAFDRAALNREIATADAKIAAVASEKVTLGSYAKAVADAQIAVNRAEQELEFHARKVREVDEDIANVEHKVGCPCSGCARPMTAAEIAPAKTSLAKVRKGYADFAASDKDRLDAASVELESATEARDAFVRGMTDVSATIAARDAASAKIAQLDGHVRNQADWTRIARERAGQATAAKAEVNPFDAMIEDGKAEIEKAAKVVEAAELACEAAEEALQIEQDVASVFSPSGVRAHILDTVTPFLNDRTARYLGTLSDGNISATWATLVKNAKGELKEKFAIEVDNDNGGATFASISGGEKRKVRIACALALQDLVASRATKAIELFIGDEIDDALDAAGLERLMTILEEKARERGSVFVISHGNLRDWIRTTLVVTKRGKISTIAEAA